MSDTGFHSSAAAAATVRRYRIKKRRVSIAQFLDLINHDFEPERDAFPIVSDQGIDLAEGKLKGSIGDKLIVDIDGTDVREQQQLQSVDMVLQRLDLVLSHIGHVGPPDRAGFENPTAAADTAHRLSETSK